MNTESVEIPALRLIQGGMANTPSANLAMSPAPASKRELLEMWRDNAQRSALTHRHESRKQWRLSVWMGVPVISFTVASAVLSAVHADLSKLHDMAVVLIGSLGAVLAGIQTFLGLDGKRSGCHQAAAAYSAMRRRIEALLANGDESPEKIESVRQDLDALGKASPLASEESFQKAAERT